MLAQGRDSVKGWQLAAAVGLVALGVAAELIERGSVLATLAIVRRWLGVPVRAPVGLLLLLPLAGGALPAILRRRRSLPTVHDYTRDRIGGVLWEWNWKLGKPWPDPPDPICPECLSRMRVTSVPVHGADGDGSPASDVARCPCGFEKALGYGGTYLDDLFRVEVDRRVRIGYWQEAIARWGRCGLPVPPPGEIGR